VADVKPKRLGRGLEALLGRIGGVEQTTFDLDKADIPNAVDADWKLQQQGRPILDYAPRSRGARAYTELCMEVLERG